jgi:hypothetical protein
MSAWFAIEHYETNLVGGGLASVVVLDVVLGLL